MALSDERLQQTIALKDVLIERHGVNPTPEGWAIMDGAMVCYDLDDPPVWLRPILDLRDEDGDTSHILADVTPMRRPFDQEYVEPVPDLVPIERAPAEA